MIIKNNNTMKKIYLLPVFLCISVVLFAQTKVTKTIEPLISSFPVVYQDNVKGGVHQVPDTDARDALPDNLKQIGMLVILQDSHATYQWDGSVWRRIQLVRNWESGADYYTGDLFLYDSNLVIAQADGTIAESDDPLTDTTNWTSMLGGTLAAGQILVGNSGGVATAVSLSGDATLDADGTLSVNSVELSGDVTVDTEGTATVGKLQNTALSSTTPTNDQVLQYDGTSWAPATIETTDEKVKVSGGTTAFPLNATDFADNGSDISIATSAITTEKIADGTITAADLAAGAVEQDNLASGAVTSDKILNNTIVAEDLNQMSATDGQVLKWDDTNSTWAADDENSELPTLGSTGDVLTVNSVGDGVEWGSSLTLGGDISVEATGSVSVEKIQNTAVSSTIPTSDQVLQYDGTSWAPATIETTDEKVKINGGTTAFPLNATDFADNGSDISIATSAITTAKIADGTITADDLAAGAVEQDNLASGAVTSDKILDNTIVAEDLNQMSATDGQVLKWDDTNSTWAADDESSELPTLGSTGDVLTVNSAGDDVEWSSSLAIGGDVSVNSAGEVTVERIRNISVASETPSAGDVLSVSSDGSSFEWGTSLALGGDISVNSTGVVSVEKLQNITVSSTAPATGQALVYDGGSWSPGTVSATDEKVVINGSTNALPLNATDFSEDASDISIATSAITSAKILNSTIAAEDLSDMGATTGQVLQYGGTLWAPATIETTDEKVKINGGTTAFPLNATDFADNGSDISIATSAITTAKIADGTITADDLAAGAVEQDNLASGAVTSDKILDNTIVAEDLNQMSATDGQVLKWDDTNSTWAADDESSELPTLGSTGDVLTVNSAGDDVEWSSSLAIGGDVSVNSAGEVTVERIRNISVASETPSAGDVLSVSSDGSSFEWGTSLALGGDISVNSSGVVSVEKLQNIAVSSTAPATGQALVYDGASWLPETVSSTDEKVVINGSTNALPLNATDFSEDASDISIATSAITSAKILNSTIAAEDLSDMGATTGQVLQYGGTLWAPATIETTDEKVKINGGTTAFPLNATDFADNGSDISIAADAITSDKIDDGTITADDLAAGAVEQDNLASGAVTTDKILNNTIVAEDLNQMSATDGQVLKWDDTNSTWAADDDEGITNGTATNNTLRWNGSAWVETNVMKIASDNKVGIGYFDDGEAILGTLHIDSDSDNPALYLNGATLDFAFPSDETLQIGTYDGTTTNTLASFGNSGDLAIDGDLTVTGNDIIFGNTEKISNATNNTLAITASIVSVSGDLTVLGDDITMGTNTSGAVLVADGSSFGPVELSGDASLSSSGELTISADAVTTDEILNNTIVAEDLNQMSATDGQVLKWDDTNSTWAASDESSDLPTLGSTGDVLTVNSAGDDVEWSSSLAIGGDVSVNSAGEVTVERIRNISVASETPSAGDVLSVSSDGSSFEWGTSLALGGDISVNSSGVVSVEKLQNIAVSSTAPATGQALVYDGASWLPETVSSTDEKVVINGSTNALPLNATDFSEDASDISIADDAITTEKIANGTITAADLAAGAVEQDNLASGAVTSDKILDSTIAAEDLSDMGAADGQVLKWDDTNSTWAPADDEGITDGTASDNTVRWDGSAWVETNVMKITSSGYVDIGSPSTSHVTMGEGDLAVASDVEVDGDLWVDGTLNTPSDKRLKINIETLTGVLAKLEQLRGVSYLYKDQQKYAAGPQVGVIAQELQKVFPELVSTGADGYLAVNYSQLTAVLLQAVKEQQTEIDQLKKQMQKVMKKLGME